MFTFDFKSGYHHVDLFPQDRKYLKVASLQVHVDLLKSGFLTNKAKCIWKPNEALRSLLGSEPFSTLPLLKFLPLTSGLPVYKEDFANRLAISSSCHPVRSLPPFAEKSYLLAPAVEMSLQSSIPRLPGTLTFVFRLKLWLS